MTILHPSLRAAHILRAILIAVALISLALSVSPGTDAAPRTVSTTIATRVKAQQEWCMGHGGGYITTKHPNGDVTVRCSGGGQDGYSCVNTASTVSCEDRIRTIPVEDPKTDSPTTADPNGGDTPAGPAVTPPTTKTEG